MRKPRAQREDRQLQCVQFTVQTFGRFLIVSAIFTVLLFPEFWAYVLAPLFFLLIVEVIGVLVINYFLPKSYKHAIKIVSWTFSVIGSLLRGVRNEIMDMFIDKRSVSIANADGKGVRRTFAAVIFWIGIMFYME
ncbi:hypothetical protein Ocin01_18964 [Orchesella cincta]|uniref:Uncharacterized protein n=1 Tax=Orchesella cincta TaxID=48709 RepID=A0A1D2M409_ORCCI|nr:hypothetical protein Ocin01_18964 [Orchesella cincta]